MKTQMLVVALIALVFLASYAPTPPAALMAAEEPGQLVELQAEGPTMTPGKGLVLVTEPNPPVGRKMYDAMIKAGIAQSQDGRRARGMLVLDLTPGDIVRLSAPYGESAVELSGEITYSLKPGEQIYIQGRSLLAQQVFIAVDGRKTDTIVFNLK